MDMEGMVGYPPTVAMVQLVDRIQVTVVVEGATIL
jgi:hypothetical protein